MTRGSLLDRGPVRAVLFDYGGTLVDIERPEAALEAAHGEVSRCLAAAGHAAPATETLRTEVHDRVDAEVSAHAESGALEEIDIAAVERRAFAAIGLELDDELRDRCSRIVQEAWFSGVRVHPEVAEVLATLRAAGLRLGVCSNAAYRAASMREQLAHVGLGRLVDAAVFSSAVGWRKPSPRIFTASLAALGAEAPGAVFVGDRLREDVGGAHAAGMRAVLVQRAASAQPRIADADPPDATIASLSGLLDLLL